METFKKLRLPRQIENDPRRASLETALSRDLRPLWDRGTLPVAHIPFAEALENALSLARVSRQLERSLEHAEKFLRNEEHGLAALREKQGAAPAYRASRLLLMANDGTERFYRSCEAILAHYGDRVLGLRLSADSHKLAQKIFGAEESAKAVLVSGKEAVVSVLLAIAAY